jgi:hypothetical protein
MSTLNHSRSVIDGMVTTMQKTRKPRINIVDVQRLENEGFARVTASVTHTTASRADHQLALDALGETMGSRMRPVEGSFHVISSNSIGDTITGVITSNPDTIAYDEAVASSFKAVAGNMFMDEEEQLWALRKTEAGDLLVKSRGKEDADVIADLMTSLSSSDVGTMAYESVSSAQRDAGVRLGLQGGDFITYVNPNTEQVDFGAVVASAFDDHGRNLGKIAVQSVEASSDPVIIDRGMALGQFEDVDFNDEGLVDDNQVEASAKSLDMIAAYYQKVFQRDPAYFEKFMERWMNHSFG